MDNQIYYHFLSAKNAINDLEKGRIKVSTVDVLNDPFEFMPYRRYGFKERQPYNKMFRTISKKWGVLCFSQSWKEQLLWAHYADKHKGIVLGFEIPEEKILKVKYTSNKIRTKFDLTDNREENEKRFLDLATEKFNEWEYEKEFRRALKFPDDVEFKFNKSSKKTREAFLRSINKFDFKIRSLVINKKLIKSNKLKSDKNSFYSYAIKTLLQNSGGSILNAKIRIDGSGDRVFRRSFLTYLRKQLNTKQKKIMKNCKLVDSKNNGLIQMVDMIVGSIKRSYYQSKTDSNIYKKIIEKHIEDEWKFK
jgi:hypothetical protein